MKWDLILSQQPASEAAANSNDSTFKIIEVEPWSGSFRDVPLESLRTLPLPAFNGLFGDWHKRTDSPTSDWRLKLNIPHQLLAAGKMTHSEWQAACEAWKASPDPAAMLRSAHQLAEAGQDMRIYDLAASERRTAGRYEIRRLLLGRLGVDDATLDQLIGLELP